MNFFSSGNEPNFSCSFSRTLHTLDTYLRIPFFNFLFLFKIAFIYSPSGVDVAITTEWREKSCKLYLNCFSDVNMEVVYRYVS